MKINRLWLAGLLLALVGSVATADVAHEFSAVAPSTAAAVAEQDGDGPGGGDAEDSDKKKKKGKKKGKKGDASPEGPKSDEKPFDEIVKDMEKVEGLFTFYRKPEEHKVLLEIMPDQFDNDYIYSAKMNQATGERGLYGTIMMGEFVFQWRKFGHRVQFVEHNTRFRADEGSPSARALENSFTDSVLASANRLSLPHPERESWLIDLSEIMLAGDMHGVGGFLKRIYKASFSPDKDNSAIVMVESFPLNTELGAVMRFKAGEVKRSSVTIPDPRFITLSFRYSLLEVPDNGYMPRLADDRIGYFMDQHLDYTSDQALTPYVRYIARWKLEKKNPDAAMSDPVEPITFWLENSVPEEYRMAMREGVLLWNKAYEKAGFSNAVVVKQQPDDAEWDPADIRYNTIRWFVGYDASFAIGPSHTNPYTGQILDADIGFAEGIIRLGARRRFQLYVDPVQAIEAMGHGPEHEAPLFTGKGDGMRYQCSYGEELADLASMSYDLLSTRSGWNSQREEEFIRQYVLEVTAHEVGHTLGLRHNFRASTINGMDQLANRERSQSIGLAASVMDYNPPVVAINGEPQGDYLPTVCGSYDEWAIEYGYKPIPGAMTPEDELPELRRIARRVAEEYLPYATDEDAGLSPRALDPRNNRFDFAADPLEWFEHEFELIDELWANMETRLVDSGDSYSVMRRAFGQTWTPYYRGAHVAMKYVGGIYHHRDHAGDPDGRLPYVPVPAAKQREAMKFLGQQVWAADTFAAPADLLRKLQFERFPDFSGSVWRATRLDYPLHAAAIGVQGEILEDLYHPIKLGRLQDNELLFADGEEAYTMGEMFTDIRESIWSELAAGSKINGFRRNLQRAHLDHLVRLIVKTPKGTPPDAVSLARFDLVALDKEIGSALSKKTDHTTTAHLMEAQARIDAALEAQLALQLFSRVGATATN